MTDPYKILGVSRTDDDETIKQAYRELARKYHPDKYRDSDLADLANDKMQEVNAAYDEIQKMRAGGNTQSQSGGDYRYSGNPGAVSYRDNTEPSFGGPASFSLLVPAYAKKYGVGFEDMREAMATSVPITLSHKIRHHCSSRFP